MFLRATLLSLVLSSVTAQTPTVSQFPSAAPSDTPSPSKAVESPLPPDLRAKSDYRCGVNEVDARGNCHSECTTSADCQDGESCWGTFTNYCHIKPEGHPQCEEDMAENVLRRCGFDEQAARSYCGNECESVADCGEAESCFPVQSNLCMCFQLQDAGEADNSTRRALQGMYGSNAEYFSAAKETIAVYFVEDGSAPNTAPNAAPTSSASTQVVGGIFLAALGSLSVATFM